MSGPTYHLEITLKKNNQGVDKLTVDLISGTQSQRLNTYNTGPSIPGDQRKLYLIARPIGSNHKLCISWKNYNGTWALYPIETNNTKKLEVKLVVKNGYDGPFVVNSIPYIYPLTKPNFNESLGPAPPVSSQGIRRAKFTEEGNIIHIYNSSTVDNLGVFIGGPFPYPLENACQVTYHDIGIANAANPEQTAELVIELISKSSENIGIEKYEVVFGSLGLPIYSSGSISVDRRVYDSSTYNYKDKIEATVNTLTGTIGPSILETPSYVLDTFNVPVQFCFRIWNIAKTANLVIMNPGNLGRVVVEDNESEITNHNDTVGQLVLMSSNNVPFQPGKID